MARDADLIKRTILHRRMQLGEAVTTTTRCLLGKIGVARFFVAMVPRLVGSSLVSRGDAECVRSGCAAESSPARTECRLCSSPLVGWLLSAARRRLSRFRPHWPLPPPTTQEPMEDGGGSGVSPEEAVSAPGTVGASGSLLVASTHRQRAARALVAPAFLACRAVPRGHAQTPRLAL